MKFKHLVLSSAIIGALSLTGCSSSSDSTAAPTPITPTPVSTAFSVNVEVPDGITGIVVASAPASFFDDFFISTASAATVSSQIGSGNFKVAIVNAAGVVTEIVTPLSVSQETNGTWVVTLEGGVRVDCVIIADISKTPNVTVGQTLPSDAIYAPTASEQFNIDIRSTSAYQEFIEAVEDTLDLTTGSGYTEEQIAALVETAQTLPLPTYSVGQTLEQYLATAIPELEAAVEREVVVINNSDPTFNLATFFEGGGVLNWFYGEGGQFYERGQFSYDTTSKTISDLEQRYNLSNDTWESYPVTNDVEDLVLTASGWIANADLDELDSFNADGSITLRDQAVAEDKEDISAVKIAVSGQQITLFTPGFKSAIASSAVFSTGAEVYELSSKTTLDTYRIWADDSSGSVKAYERYNGTYNVITTLDEMFSATASSSTDPTQMNLIRNDSATLELIGSASDTSGTVNIITIDTGTTPNVATVTDTTTWERRMVEGKDIVLIDATGNAIQEEEGDAGFYMLTVYPDTYAGVEAVVEGWFQTAGTANDEDDYVFNDIAAADINNNFDPNLMTCSFSSTWVNNEPSPFNSYDQFLEVLADCGGALPLAAADLEGMTFSESSNNGSGIEVESITYNTGGTFNFEATLDGTTTETDTGTWSLANNLLTLTNTANDFFDVMAVVGPNHQLAYSEESSWSSNPDMTASNSSVAEGEIWHGYATSGTSTTTPPPTSGLACDTESGWDDNADGGLGAPITPHSFADYETVVEACGAISFTSEQVQGRTFDDGGETSTYDAKATVATEANPGTGTFSSPGESINFRWYVEAATCTGCFHDYLVVYSSKVLDPVGLANAPDGFEFREISAVKTIQSIDATIGNAGDTFSNVYYSEQSNYGDMVRDTGTDGEIWSSTTTVQ